MEEVPLVFDPLESRGFGRSATGPGRLKVWNVKTGRLKYNLDGHSLASAVAFSSDGTLLASAGRWSGHDDGTGVIIWNALTGKKLTTILQEANAGTHAVVFSPTNKLVAIGSRQYDKENDTYTTAVSLTYALSGITQWKRTFPGWANPKAFSPMAKWSWCCAADNPSGSSKPRPARCSTKSNRPTSSRPLLAKGANGSILRSHR